MDTNKFRETYPDLKVFSYKEAKGDVDARFVLARYSHAEGNVERALKRYLAGANARHATSMYYAGVELHAGQVIGRDDRKAIKFLIRASNLGEEVSREEYARSGLEPFEPYFPIAAESAYRAGRMFEKGLGERRDPWEARYYYERSIEQADHLGGLVALASLYRRGIGTKRDLEKAVELLRQAAKREYPPAFYDLGEMHDKGGGLEEDLGTAAEYYWEAARRGHPAAALTLARRFAEGNGIEQDLVGGLLWFGWADSLGERQANDGIKKILPKLGKKEISQAREDFVKARENFANHGLFDEQP